MDQLKVVSVEGFRYGFYALVGVLIPKWTVLKKIKFISN